MAKISALTFLPSGLGENKSDLIAIAAFTGPAYRQCVLGDESENDEPQSLRMFWEVQSFSTLVWFPDCLGFQEANPNLSSDCVLWLGIQKIWSS